MISAREHGFRGNLGRWTIRAAPLLFLALASVVGFRKPGLQYDEALFQHGTVQMLTFGTEPRFAHDPGSWVEAGGRFWPVMVLPYIGAAAHYMLLPVFGILGPDPAAARAVCAVIGALGLFGIVHALAIAFGPGVAVVVAFLLAIHPGLLLTVLYDNTGCAMWMACLGLIAMALSRYSRRRDAASAFWVGSAAGVGVWCRANFLWFLVPLAVSTLVIYGRTAVPSRRNLGALVFGGAVGSFPLLLYEYRSGWATFGFLRQEGTLSPIATFSYRLEMFVQSVFCDSSREAIWGSPGVPRWQLTFVAAVVVGSAVAVWAPRHGAPSREDRAARVAALTFVGYLAFAFASRLRVAPHHLVPVVPLEAVIVAMAIRRLPRRLPVRIVMAALAVGYAALSGLAVAGAARGIRATGGVGAWSDAIEKLADLLQNKYPRRDVYLLSWGFENNLFVLSGGAIASVEAFSSGTGPGLALDPAAVYVVRRWDPEDAPGSALALLLDRIRGSAPSFERTRVFQRDGKPYADVYGGPNRLPVPARITAIDPPRISAGNGFNVQPSGDSAIAIRGAGFRVTDVVWWNDRPLTTTFGSPGLITAVVPGRLYAEPGMARITIRHGNALEPGAEAEVSILAGTR